MWIMRRALFMESMGSKQRMDMKQLAERLAQYSLVANPKKKLSAQELQKLLQGEWNSALPFESDDTRKEKIKKYIKKTFGEKALNTLRPNYVQWAATPRKNIKLLPTIANVGDEGQEGGTRRKTRRLRRRGTRRK